MGSFWPTLSTRSITNSRCTQWALLQLQLCVCVVCVYVWCVWVWCVSECHRRVHPVSFPGLHPACFHSPERLEMRLEFNRSCIRKTWFLYFLIRKIALQWHTCGPMVTWNRLSGASPPTRNRFGPLWCSRYSLALMARSTSFCLMESSCCVGCWVAVVTRGLFAVGEGWLCLWAPFWDSRCRDGGLKEEEEEDRGEWCLLGRRWELETGVLLDLLGASGCSFVRSGLSGWLCSEGVNNHIKQAALFLVPYPLAVW